MFQKITTIVLCVLCTVSFSACSGDREKDKEALFSLGKAVLNETQAGKEMQQQAIEVKNQVNSAIDVAASTKATIDSLLTAPEKLCANVADGKMAEKISQAVTQDEIGQLLVKYGVSSNQDLAVKICQEKTAALTTK